ncbi:MAG TPA: nitroreductase family deazaflavin-dependent oxidoreductase [Ktedonosporobacter sp.]|nr:nitroreductase family deazaflavin-dependent oxidoreductase [Ktedonosporobacter sp.]
MSNWSGDVNEWNNNVIKEFRANKGNVSGAYKGARLLLLNTIGAKSGQPRTTPLGYMADGDRLIVLASVMGAPHNPAWYHNLVAHPEVTVEVGGETFDATAIVAQGAERERLWAKLLGSWPIIADHQAKTTRQIPVIILQR